MEHAFRNGLRWRLSGSSRPRSVLRRRLQLPLLRRSREDLRDVLRWVHPRNVGPRRVLRRLLHLLLRGGGWTRLLHQHPRSVWRRGMLRGAWVPRLLRVLLPLLLQTSEGGGA